MKCNSTNLIIKGMIVIHKNRLCTLDMQYCIFESLQQDCPDCDVEIYPLTPSFYKERINCSIGDLADYSIVRNLNALNKN